jgi:hypothetical protein
VAAGGQGGDGGGSIGRHRWSLPSRDAGRCTGVDEALLHEAEGGFEQGCYLPDRQLVLLVELFQQRQLFLAVVAGQ